MREFSDEEVNLYNQFSLPEGLSACDTANIIGTTKSNDIKDNLFNIQSLTRDFLVGLQENFPATIPTISRTGEKLYRNEEILIKRESTGICVLCHGKRDAFGNTLEATNFSKLVSCKGKDEFERNFNLTVDAIKHFDINETNLGSKGKYITSNYIKKN